MSKIIKKILLVDVDSKIPNIALMKLSTYYKSKGYGVELLRLGYSGYPLAEPRFDDIDASGYSKVFVSSIYDLNDDKVLIRNCENVFFGGTGYSVSEKLPDVIDNLDEDYSIYPENKFSYGFITRGCIRKCKFCLVPEKEGMIYRYREIWRIVRHDITYFLDNNILAYKECEKVLQELVRRRIRCQFNQGLDMRLMTRRKAELLGEIPYVGDFIFAFDRLKDQRLLEKNLAMFRKYSETKKHIKFFVYCSTEHEISDVLHRVQWCRKQNVLVYLMRNVNCFFSKDKSFYNLLAGWTNHPPIFLKMDFEAFIKYKTSKVEKQKYAIGLWRKSFRK